MKYCLWSPLRFLSKSKLVVRETCALFHLIRVVQRPWMRESQGDTYDEWIGPSSLDSSVIDPSVFDLLCGFELNR